MDLENQQDLVHHRLGALWAHQTQVNPFLLFYQEHLYCPAFHLHQARLSHHLLLDLLKQQQKRHICGKLSAREPAVILSAKIQFDLPKITASPNGCMNSNIAHKNSAEELTVN